METRGAFLRVSYVLVARFALFLSASLALAFGMCFWMVRINDPDSFYHTAHAMIYWEHGPFYREFPWAAYSVISERRADLWWGLHVLLSPLGALNDPYLALRVGPAVLITLHLLILYAALTKLKVNPWWAFAMFTGANALMMRMQTVRPQSVSSALLVLIFAAVVTKDRWLALFAGICLGFIHPTLFYMVVPVGLAGMIAVGIREKKFDGLPASLALVSSMMMAVVRPGIPDGLQLLKVQLVDLTLIRRQKIIPNFGVELDTAPVSYFVNHVLPIGLVLLVALVLARREKERVAAFCGSLFVLAVGIGVMVFLTKRGIDQVVPFAGLSAVLMLDGVGKVPLIGLLAVLVNSGNTIGSYFQAMRRKPATGLEMKGSAAYLAANTRPGEIVFHPVWSQFAELIFWNRHNRYIGGMDPIFQYTYSKELYWKQTLTAPKRVWGLTGPTDPRRASSMEEPIWRVIPRDFKSRWIAFPKEWAPDYQTLLRKDKRHFALRFEDSGGMVFEIVGR